MPIEITPHVTSLHVDLSWFPQPYPPNVFLIRDGGEAAIIDAGFSDDESFNTRTEILEELGAARSNWTSSSHTTTTTTRAARTGCARPRARRSSCTRTRSRC